ncbi:MAG: phospholipase D family protein [Proteobacteria bacterium]|uniref:phospholipase D-like domain-containing protein n=1 Tax=Rudaea sp. TaxID=2136325 RepID=UPI00321F6128|nr:phospholipase D family protein [Pseudomonadota bacterium]
MAGRDAEKSEALLPALVFLSPHRAFVFPLAVALALLAGCALDPIHARRAAATASAAQDRSRDCAPERRDACAIDTPYRSLVAAALQQSTPAAPVHYVNLIERGEDALLLRVHLIRSARRSIEIQTFIFSEDDAGTLVLDELVAAARRGVQVRVIADQLFSLDDAKLYAALARAHANFEFRVYNPTLHKASTPPLEFAAGVLCCFWRFNQRMHDKMLLVDGEIGIVGGRNYENRYYDWDGEFDYRDRDLLAAGPVGATMRAAFDAFWNSAYTVPLSRLRDVAGSILDAGIDAPRYAMHAYRNPARVAALSRRTDDTEFIRAHFVADALRVGRVDYFSDLPGKPSAGTARRESTRPLVALLRAAQSEIVLQTPYLVLSATAKDIFRELHRRASPPHVIVSTNSLAATDAFYVYALSYKYKKRYLRLGFEIHEFKPFPAEAAELIANYAELGAEPAQPANTARSRARGKFRDAPLKRGGVRVGLHAKSMVIDGEIAVIGSHNFDPRSEKYNTEAGFIVRDAALAARLRDSILRDTQADNAWTIAKRQRTRILGGLNNAIANLSAALPIFDLWPFRYASSFEFDPTGMHGTCRSVPPGHADFYACHTDVGDFPEVDLPLKTIYTRIVTAFGAGLVSIM